MTPDRARELLGGLAAGILTPEERKTLFEAALHDQTLFNEVADELEFGAFLQSPETRAQLANRIEVEPAERRWWALRPGWLALSGVLAASIVLFVAIRQRPGEVAQLSITAPKDTALTAPPPAPEADRKLPPQVEPKGAPIAKLPAKQEAAKVSSPDSRDARQSEAAPARRAAKDEAESKAETSDSLKARPAASGNAIFGESAAPRAAPMAPAAATPQPAPPPPPPPAAIAGALMDKAAGASLTGTVHDATGAAVRGATVDIVNPATNTTVHAATDANGRFVALSLPPGGPYTVTANAPGFIKELRSVTVDGNQPVQLDIPLRVGDMAQAVNVSGAASMLQNQNLRQVAVLDFVNGGQQSQSGAQVADQLSNQLLRTGQFGVIDREKVQQAAQSQRSTGRPANAQEAAAIGRSVGADAVILGRVQAPGVAGAGTVGGFAKAKVAPNVSVMAEIIDTKKSQAPVTVSAAGTSLQGATNNLGNKIQSQLAKPAEGKVTRRSGDVVSVEFAEQPGLQAGARCDVIRGTRKIGELTITSVNGLSAFGKFSGTSQPRAGDRVTSSR